MIHTLTQRLQRVVYLRCYCFVFIVLVEEFPQKICHDLLTGSMHLLMDRRLVMAQDVNITDILLG